MIGSGEGGDQVANSAGEFCPIAFLGQLQVQLKLDEIIHNIDLLPRLKEREKIGSARCSMI
jgi:hypothetical protein